jgi:tetratricopeptide (TPR) repeat protein
MKKSTFMLGVLLAFFSTAAHSAPDYLKSPCQLLRSAEFPNEKIEACTQELGQPGISPELKANLLVRRSRGFQAIGDETRSLADLENGLKEFPLDPQLSAEMAWRLMDSNRLDAAFSLVEHARAKTPHHPELYFTLANLYRKKGDYPQAALVYEESLKNNPDQDFTRYQLADFYLNFTYQRTAAIEHLSFLLAKNQTELKRDILDIEPDLKFSSVVDVFRFQRGMAYYLSNQYSEAMIDADIVVAHDKENPFALELIALIQMDLPGGTERATKALDQALANCEKKLLPEFCTGIMDSKLKLLWKKQMLPDVVQTAEQMLSRPANWDHAFSAIYYHAMAKEQLGDSKSALKDIDVLMGYQPLSNYSKNLQRKFQHFGYFEGTPDEPWSEASRNALMACLVDPVCTL